MFFFIFIYFGLCSVVIASTRLSLVVATGSYSLDGVCGLLTAVASLVVVHGLQGTWAQQFQLTGYRVWAQQLWPMGLAAPWHVASPWTSDGTRISCIDRWILYHWTTREALILHFKRSH